MSKEGLLSIKTIGYLNGMSEVFNEWLPFIIRWIHLIAGISWIGNSFYFMWLDSSFEPLAAPKSGVDGELYMVHGGHFYHVEKQKIRPEFLPNTLHWFKWEATFTWLSGFILLILLYYLTGGVYLIAPTSYIQSPKVASLVSLALIFGSWFAYDFFWQSGFAERNKKMATTLSLVGAVALSWGLCKLYTGRGAYIHLGAIFGTLMVANVWIRILPGQRVMLETAKEGKSPNYNAGEKAKWRSTHNSYITLPVLFLMLSNHLPLAYGHELNWIILVLICVFGGLVRHMMLQWNKGKSGAGLLIPVGATLALLVGLTSGAFSFMAEALQPKEVLDAGPPVGFEQVKAIVVQRCTQCHSQHPTDDLFHAPPNGVILEDTRTIQKLARRIRERVWATKTMPLANKTQMTDSERDIVRRWIDQGARVDHE